MAGRRRTVRFAIAAGFVLAGAVVNVLIAWGLFVRAAEPQLRPVAPSPAAWNPASGWPASPEDAMAGSSLGLTFHAEMAYEGQGDLRKQYQYSRFAAGWPARSMALRSWLVLDPSLTGTNAIHVRMDGPECDWLPENQERLSYGALPVRPVWPGFVLNTAFYAALLAILAHVPSAVRRFFRRRRGACPRCGYNLAGIGAGRPCPECGAATAEAFARGRAAVRE